MTAVAVASPNPSSQAGGVERFCHLLATGLRAHRLIADVVTAVDAGHPSWDVVISNGMIGVRTSVPRIHVYHGCWPEHMRYDHRSAPTPWRVKRAIQGAWSEARAGAGARRVAVSASAARELRRWYGYRSVQVVPNAVDMDVFRPRARAQAREWLGVDSRSRLALFPGRPEPRKRPDLALQVARECDLTVAHPGSVPMRGAQEVGLLSAAEMACWLAAVDLVLAPSDYEACSFAVLEALAVGTPVVATRVGWLRDLVDAVPAYRSLTAARGDVAGLRDAARWVLGSLTKHEEARAATEEAAMYVRIHNNVEAFAGRYARLVSDLIGPRA